MAATKTILQRGARAAAALALALPAGVAFATLDGANPPVVAELEVVEPAHLWALPAAPLHAEIDRLAATLMLERRAALRDTATNAFEQVISHLHASRIEDTQRSETQRDVWVN